METSTLITVYTSLLLAGLAGSLHCVGMCGPILASFTAVFERVRLTVEGHAAPTSAAPRFPLLLDLVGYHAGRIWTYAMLGLLAGVVGQKLRQGSALLGWQRPAAIAIAAIVVGTGIVMLGLIPGLRAGGALLECGSKKFAGLKFFAPLLQGRGWLPRLLLGAVMGLLPCGLVYAMLVVVAPLPHPLLSAAGMVIFGLGTLPALCGVVLASRWLPRSLRAQGVRLAAVLVILAGGWMLARAVLVSPQSESCPACASSNP